MALVAGGKANGIGSSSLTGGNGGVIDLGAVGKSIDQQQQLVTQRSDVQAIADQKAQALGSATLKEVTAVNDASRASADETRQRQLSILDGVNGQLAKAKVAISLADSNNPLDRIKLWALQQSDPSYTREGNLNRIGYYQQAADAVGGIEVLKQTGYQSQIEAAKSKLSTALQPDQDMLATLQIGIDQGQRKLDAAKDAATTRLSLMQTNNSIQENALANLDMNQTANAEQQALASKDKVANVGGVDISLAQIQTRKAALVDRNWLLFSHQQQAQTAALSDLTLTDVNTKIAEASTAKDQNAQLDSGISVSLAALNARKADLVNQDTGVQQNLAQQAITARQMLNMTNQKIVDGMSPTELNRAILAGGKDPNMPGVQFDMDQLKAALATKVDATNTDIQTKASIAALGKPMEAASQFNDYLTNVLSNAEPGSPLANTVKANQAQFQFAAGLLEDPDPMTVGAGATVMTNIRANTEAAIDLEAKRMSNGDADKEIALKSQLRGQAIPQEVIAGALSKRAAKGAPLTGWLTASNATAYMKVFQQTRQALNASAAAMGLSQSDVNQQASEEAMKAVMSQASQQTSDNVIGAQVNMPGNPLKGLMSPSEFLSLYHNADTAGATQFQRDGQKSDADMAALLSGQVNDPQFFAAQGSALYMELEKKQPGLGEAYINWWNSPARDDYITKMSAGTIATAGKKGFSSLVEQSLIAPTLTDQMSHYATIMSQGKDYALSSDFKRQHQNFINFGGDPVSKEAFVLQQTPGLTDTDKQQAMTLIFKPLFDTVSQAKMPMDQAAVYIESQLRQMKPDDPGTKALLKKITTNRDAALKIIDDFQSIQPPYAQVYAANPLAGVANFVQSKLGLGRVGPNADSATSSFGWLQDWRKQQGAN